MSILEIISFLQSQYPGSEWVIPPKFGYGVLSTNHAFVVAKAEKRNPVEVATEVVEKLSDLFHKNKLPFTPKNVGPYINIDLEDAAVKTFVQDNLSIGSIAKNMQLRKINQSFVIDMFHPNVGKKMHVGHIRSANLGEAMRRILSLKYRRVISDSYLGDWGIQFSYTTWGILHLTELGLAFNTIDIDTEDRLILVDKFYKIYVRMNQLIEEKPEIRLECQKNSKLLENGMQGMKLTSSDQQKFEFLHNLYRKIVSLSLVQFREGEAFLNINQNPSWLKSDEALIPLVQIDRVKDKTGCHYAHSSHQQGLFDLTLGESFYISFLSEMFILAENGLAKQEGQAIYVDLEDEKLGRAYLISSEGYSLYHTRDIICRMVYAGIFGFDNAISFVDLRQAHSFKQVFAVLRRIIDSKIYENRAFGWLTLEETKRALKILGKKMAMFEGFGHLNLPDGAMSTRKGKIFAFEDLKEMLLEKVRDTLQEKQSNKIDEEKVRKMAIASLKWVDLHRDREQDSVFDPSQFLKFEGNTGVYQLYTLVRLNSILKNNSQVALDPKDLNINKLQPDEVYILKQTYTLPFVLETVSVNYKPHILCNYLFELATTINSWYAQYSVSTEKDETRKKTLLVFCQFLHQHLEFALSLLGIESVEEI